MTQLLEIIPIVLFFVVYQYDGTSVSVGTWTYTFDGIFSATAVLMVATLIQVFVNSLLKKRLEKRDAWILLAVGLFGGITLWFRDPSFIQWKPTIFNWALALVFLASHIFSEKNLIQKMLGAQLSLPTKIWKRLNLLWIGNFTLVGTLNIIVALNFNEAIWVSYKLYSAIGFTLLLMILTIVLVSPYLSDENPIKSETNE